MANEQLRIFLDVPNDIDETWTHVALFGGMVDRAHDEYSLAENFKQAGDVLIQQGLKSVEAYNLLYPVLYNYRHAIELYLKSIVKPSNRSHNLAALLDQFKKLVKENHKTITPIWFETIIKEFIEFDPASTTFRYPGQSNSPEELMVDLPKLEKIMNILEESFHRVYLAEQAFQKRS